MSETKKVTYEEARDHVDEIIRKHPHLTLRDVCRWVGKKSKGEYHYVWQVLDGSYGKSKRSPNVVKTLAKALQKRGFWYELGNIPDKIEK